MRAPVRFRFFERNSSRRDGRSMSAPIGGLLAIAFALIFVAYGARPDAAHADSSGDAKASGPRFELTGSGEYLFRIDTQTGQVWAVPTNGDGGWQPVGSAAAASGQDGRFGLVVLAGRRARTALGGGGSSTPRMLRTDGLTGRAWLADALPTGEWTQISDPDSTIPAT